MPVWSRSAGMAWAPISATRARTAVRTGWTTPSNTSANLAASRRGACWGWGRGPGGGWWSGSRLGLAYQWNSLRLAANAGRNEAQTAAGTHTRQRVLSSGVIWTAQPALNLGLTYYHAGRSRTGAHKDGYGRWVTFAEYKLSRRTQLYAELDSTRWRDGYQGAANPATATAIAAGVVHRF